MDKLELMKLLNEVYEDHLKVDAIRQLGPYINDSKVLDSLCREAIETDSHRVREALIKTLKGNQEEANRRWALISLSLMECGRCQRSRYARVAGSASIGAVRGGI